MKKYAIIVAGGKGLRLGNALPKQFLEIHHKPVLYYSIKAFIDAYADIKIILVLPEDFLSYANTVLQCFPERIDITIVSGGAERYHSVINGFNAIADVHDNAIVFIHDAARPMITPQLIRSCYTQACDTGNAIPVIAVKDSLRCVEGNTNKAVNRDHYKIVQTPQTFRYTVLERVLALPYSTNFTDEATALEKIGEPIYLIQGEENNFKITHAFDLALAEKLLS